ncbi:MAG: hypothetical protein EOO08_06885 [Chitinophagaceae bacterium]|nr:MAG: hypothetical protein EOO08_06885 [Chitinophagaceae bacterium]
MRFLSAMLLAGVVAFASCKKDDRAEYRASLIFKFRFDSTQVRLNNVGQPTGLAMNNAAQSPVFNSMSAHYLELAPTAHTALGSGVVLYRAAETTAGGPNAIDFSQANIVGNGGVFLSVPLTDVPPGEYEWLRTSLSYQNFDVKFYVDDTIATLPIRQEFMGTVAGFLGFNNYIGSFRIKDTSIAVGKNRPQGFWGFESLVRYQGYNFRFVDTATAMAGATTVVNPLFATSPIPPGSCVVTASFAPGKLVIRGDETKNIVVEVSLSTNKSFEWYDLVRDGRWEPGKGETVQDMGVRGMIPKVVQ